MWQQDLFQVDDGLLRECQPLEAPRLLHSPATATSELASFPNTCATTTAPDFCCWQRAATLVQSPASASSEGSATSTPDQCPASPAASLCEMPSSRNGGCCNNVMASTTKQQKQQHHHHQQQGDQKQQHTPSPWSQNLHLTPSSSSAMQSSIMDLDWSRELDSGTLQAPAGPCTSFTSKDFAPVYGSGWSSILSESKASTESGYMLEGLNQALAPKAELSCREVDASSTSSAFVIEPSVTLACAESQPVLSSFGSLFASSERQRVKQEVEQFTAGPNALVIDEKIFSLQKSGSSKIGNFIDLLRQSDRPVSDATAAASCNHLSQLLTSQEAPGMWIARSSRLPAMLSEVLPTPSSRPLLESATSNADNQERVHVGQRQESSSSRKNLKQQEADEPLSDRPAYLRAAANTDITSELFSKRPRIENSSSFPFKMQVRKEKLGERISALQQLVSPFGKTDTASVLLEAIGYIKFLHEQVQVLSSPYMKHTGATTRNNEHGKFGWSSPDKDGEATKPDLRSRGLCLVPISCTLQVANDNGADYWTPTLHGSLK